ncbi:MAG: aminoglycoside phosphotransferase [Gammaproteobacteria bacterium]|nr:aminoglycoside phosphotransferase [Gammaproteobacteria bacterium]
MTTRGEFSGTTAVREAHRFDETRLAQWMSEHVDGYRGPLTVEQFNGGQSNPTYKVLTPDRVYVMRRRPPGHLLKGAHAVEREARVLRALERAGFPVAHVHGLCTDNGVIGTWFYVMDCVAGRIIWDATFPDVPREDRPRYFDSMNETLARLHCVDYQAIGLADYSRPGNYFERQITRWSQQYRDDVQYAGRDPNMDRLIEWLPAHIPPGVDTTLVHGDFRIDNLIFDPSEPRVVAVLDWELSTLGHPLADFAYHAMMYRVPPRIITGLEGSDLRALNIPTEAEYVASYCRRTGRAGILHLDFYIAFNMFRLAAIFHGIKGRLARGTAVSAHAMEYAAGVEWLAELAWTQAERAMREDAGPSTGIGKAAPAAPADQP